MFLVKNRNWVIEEKNLKKRRENNGVEVGKGQKKEIKSNSDNIHYLFIFTLGDLLGRLGYRC